MGLSKRLLRLFAVAAGEDAALEEIEKAGMGLDGRIMELAQTLTSLAGTKPNFVNPSAALEYHAQLTPLQQESADLRGKRDRGQRAAGQRRHIRTWLAPLFNEPETDPKHSGALASLIPSPKIYEAIGALHIDPYKLRSWADLDKPGAAQPAKRYITQPYAFRQNASHKVGLPSSPTGKAAGVFQLPPQ
jgi:hypothetical protein